MRKLFLLLAFTLSSVPLLFAQDDCVGFFPKNKGAVLVKSNYDANNNLLSTITYIVDKTHSHPIKANQQIGFTVKDAQGTVVDSGDMQVSCDNGSFYMKMTHVAVTLGAMNALRHNTEMVSDMVDYPDIFSTPPSDNVFKVDTARFSIRSKSDHKERMKVKVHNREYVREEKITTPAGIFEAYKVTFDIETTQHKETTTHKAVEWFAYNAGVIKSELYDTNKKLVSRSELTTLKLK